MRCPHCGNEQADGWLSCQKCHIIFSRWRPDAAVVPQPQSPTPPAPAPRPGAASDPPRPVTLFGDRPPGPPPSVGPVPPAALARRPAPWWGYLAMLLPFAAGLWWLLNPSGRPLEPGSFRDGDKQFAVRAPDGWLTLTRENYDAFIRQYGSQLPAQFMRAPGGTGVAISFVRIGPPGEFPPSLNVVTMKGAPPPINEKSKLEAAKAIADGFRAVLSDYRQESVRIIDVDKIRSLEIVSTAASPLRLPGAAGRDPSHLRYRQVLVPGKKRTFIMTFTDSMDSEGEFDDDYRRSLSSFRVLARPPRFGPVVNGGFFGGLLGGLLYLLGGMFRSLGLKREE
jgi:hypothetical protein